VQWVSGLTVGVLVTLAGGCSSDSSPDAGAGGQAGSEPARPETGGHAGAEVVGFGGSGAVTSTDVGGTPGTGADTGAGGTGGSGTAASGATGGDAGIGGDVATGGGDVATGGGVGVGGIGGGTGGATPSGGESTGGIGGAPVGGSGGGPMGGGGGAPPGGTQTGGAATGGAGAGGAETGGVQTGGTSPGPCEDPGTTHAGGTQYCENGSVDLVNGYVFDVWTNATGSGCATVFDDEATFKVDWTGPGDFFARVGLEYDGAPPSGAISSDFAVTGSGSGLAFIGVHGWMDDPVVEFYILEDWVNDPDGSPPVFGSSRGIITVDGGTYDVYHRQVGQGGVLRYETYSVRTESRQCGRISISEHFSEWAAMGLQMGAPTQVKLYIDGIDGTGSYEFTRGSFSVE
jgi:endo-1,4-beta-xylanase